MLRRSAFSSNRLSLSVLPFWLPACTAGLLLLAEVPRAQTSNIWEPASVEGLSFRTVSANVVLEWPSQPRESFAVLWRSNPTPETPWVVLSSQLRARSDTNRTTFCHIGASARAQNMLTNSGLPDLYRVFVIPDFWFDMEWITLTGGPKNPGEDFLPFYYGSRVTGVFKPRTELLVDGEPAGVGSTLDEDMQRVNFGTVDKPQWAYAAGFWFDHGAFAGGEHTLQLQSLLALNSFVGDWSWSVTLTNRPVRVRTAPRRAEEEAKGSEKLLGSRRVQAQLSWWGRRLGPGFVRKRPSPQEAEAHFVHSESDLLPQQTQPRPWKPISPANANKGFTP
jgi:hypothetical protein